MHLKVFSKLKKTLKTLSSGQIYIKKTQKPQKNPGFSNPAPAAAARLSGVRAALPLTCSGLRACNGRRTRRSGRSTPPTIKDICRKDLAKINSV